MKAPVAMVYKNPVRFHREIQSHGRSSWKKKNNNVHIKPIWIKTFVEDMKVGAGWGMAARAGEVKHRRPFHFCPGEA